MFGILVSFIGGAYMDFLVSICQYVQIACFNMHKAATVRSEQIDGNNLTHQFARQSNDKFGMANS